MTACMSTLSTPTSLNNHKSEVETWEHINELMKLLSACDFNLQSRWLGRMESGYSLKANEMSVLDVLDWFAWSRSSLATIPQEHLVSASEFIDYQASKGFDPMMQSIILNTLDDLIPGTDICLWISFSIRERMFTHDRSKLKTPEVEIFTEWTPQLRNVTYGSEEYHSMLRSIAPALTHHYAHNRHHPECFKDGVSGMNLIDLLEMIADWKASTLRHADGDILRSIEINRDRFKLSDQVTQILTNTVSLLEPPFTGVKTQRDLHRESSTSIDRLKPLRRSS